MNLVENYELEKEDLVLKNTNEFIVDPKKPAILMIGWHSCIRVTKICIALAKQGHRLGLITNRLPASWNIFDRVLTYHDDTQLVNSIKTMSDDYDIIHVHNEPNVLMLRALVNSKDKPIVLDMHDLNILRKGHCREDEILAITRSDAIVHVSKPIEEFVNELYGYTKPTCTIESRCSRDFIIEDKGHSRANIVYQGGIRIPEDLQDFSYRDLYPISNALSQENYQMHFYSPSSEALVNKYKEAGGIIHQALNYGDLLQALAHYKFGWTGFIQDPPKRHVQWAMTNKFFEYINCGTPVLVYNTTAQAEYVEKFKIGIVIKTLRNLREQIEAYDWNELHGNVLKHRESFAIENHIQPLIDVYNSLK